MPSRHYLLATAIAIAACANQQPAQSASLDTTRATAASAPSSTDTALAHADKARIQGAETATVWIVMASDFQCPVCKRFHDETYRRILTDYIATGKTRFAYLNHPVSGHQFAVVAAEAAMCAGMQDRFWQMHDALFATQDNWVATGNPVPVFDSLATALQLRVADWRACMSSHRTRPLIDADNARTTANGVSGTPSFFIANKLAVVGLAPYATFRAALDSALAHAGPPAGAR